MAESEQAFDNDFIYQKLLNNCQGKGAELGAAFCDEVFDFLRRKTNLLHQPRCGALIKQRLTARVATAKEDFMSPKKKQPKHAKNPMNAPVPMSKAEADAKRAAESKKKAEKQKAMEVDNEKKEQIDEIEELDPDTMKPKVTTETKKIEVDDEEESESGEMPNEGNGGSTDTYRWVQTLDEIDMRVEVPPHIKGKHLNVDVKKDRIIVGLKGEKPMIDGELHSEVSESMWTLETAKDKKYVCINMDKRKGMCWWKYVVKGDIGIKTKKIQPENSKLADLDGETRQTVEKMMFDQRQKEMGKPTSKELDQRAKLAKFMEHHPEMDFSNAKFNGPGGSNFNLS